MRRSKKFIIIAVTVAAVLAGTLNGVAFAQTGNEDEDQPEAKWEALVDRVLEIYEEKTGVAINQEALKDSFIQARGEMRTEALQNRLQNLVDQERITQGEADEYLEWWQAKPDTPLRFGFQGLGRLRCMRAFPGWGEINPLP